MPKSGYAKGFAVCTVETGDGGGEGRALSTSGASGAIQFSLRASHMTVLRSKFSKNISSQKRALGSAYVWYSWRTPSMLNP